MKKNLTKKLMLSVLTLAFAVVSLGASTFAWFTTSKTAQVETFSANVIGGSGIEISVAAWDWKNDKAIWQSEYYVNNLPMAQVELALTKAGFSTFNHVTSLSIVDDALTVPTKFVGNLYNLDGSAADTKSFVGLRFFVRIQAKGTLALSTVSMERAADSEGTAGWASGVSYELGNSSLTDNDETVDVNEALIAPTDLIAYNVADAARLAVIHEGVTKVYETEEAAGNETQSGNKQGYSSKGAYQIYNAKNETDLKSLPSGQLPNGYTLGGAAADQNFDVEVQLGDVEVFDVFVWIEGYDSECLNGIFAQKLSLTLGFEWTEPAA